MGLQRALWGAPFLLLALLGPAPKRRVGSCRTRRVLHAVRQGDRAALRTLLSSGLPVDAPLDWLLQRTALMEACLRAQAEIARALLEAGADPNRRGRAGDTPLMAACASGSATLVGLLIERGADVRAVGHGSNPLGSAIHHGHAEIVRLLLDAGAKPHDSVAGQTALSLAEERGKTDVLDVLRERTFLDRFESDLKKGAVGSIANELKNVDARGPDGRTALIIASRCGNLEAVQQLLKAGADVRGQDNAGRTALHAAVEEGSVAITTRLLEAEAEVDAVDAEGETPLLTACRRGRVAAVRALLSAGAKPDIRDRRGDTALVVAGRSGHWELERDLLSAGATPDAAYEKMAGLLLNGATARGTGEELQWRLNGVQDAELRKNRDGRIAGRRFSRSRASGGRLHPGGSSHRGNRRPGADADGDRPRHRTRRSRAAPHPGGRRLRRITDSRHSVQERTGRSGARLAPGGRTPTLATQTAPAPFIAAQAGLSDLEGAFLSAGAVADETYRQFTQARERGREAERRLREQQEREARGREDAVQAERAARRARMRGVAGHQKCSRCAAARSFFLATSLEVVKDTGAAGRPYDYGGACRNCLEYFCSNHVEDGLCPFCGGTL